MRLRYSRRALAQLAAVHEYLRERDASAADRVTASIATTIARLKELPLLGRPADEPGVRLIIDPTYLYRAFYRVDGQEVFVIRILHRAQDR